MRIRLVLIALAASMLLAACTSAPPRAAEEDDGATGADDARRYLEIFQRDEHGVIPDGGLARAIAQRELALARRTTSDEKIGGISRNAWMPVGPGVVGGRVRALLYDRTDASRVYLGSASGGIWRSFDGGANWDGVGDFTASLSITSFAQDPADANVLYAATGEFSGFRGVGVMKSVDRGSTWSMLPSTDPGANSCWRYVQHVAVHPAQPATLLAANWCGIYRSTNGGTSWTRVHRIVNVQNDVGMGWGIAFAPGNADRVVAAMSNRSIALSTDGGATFATLQLGTPVNDVWTNRVSVAWSASDPSIVYASVNENSGDFYRSADGGLTWTLVSNPAHLGTQGDYGNSIWVDPTNANLIVIGGVDLHRSGDGGLTWTRISDWRRQYFVVSGAYSAHADHHAIVSHPAFNGTTNRTLLFGTDGGVYRHDDVYSAAPLAGWQVSSGRLVTTQFYRVHGVRGANGLALIGGTQDNSVFASAPSVASGWLQVVTGDGGWGEFDPADPTRAYFQLQYLHLRRWNLATNTSTLICDAIADTDCASSNPHHTNFIAPVVVDPTNGERVIAGAASVWMSDDARSASSPSWCIVKPASTALIDGEATNYVSTLALRPGASNVVWAGHNNGELYVTRNVLAPTPLWTPAGAGVLPGRAVTTVAFDPLNANRVLATFGGYTADNVWASDNDGVTWRSLSTGLPQAPAYTIAASPTRANTLYVGTEVGIFVSEDGGQSWSTTNDGPAATRVRTLFFADASTLVAGTYGRGLWSASTAASAVVPQTGWWWNPGESGRGFFVEQRGTTIVMAGYIYANNAAPIWFLGVGTVGGNVLTVPMQTYVGGQSLTGAYHLPSAGASLGQISIRFTSATTADVTWPGGFSSVVRFPFGAGGPGTPETGWWWNAAESGRGFSLETQGNTLFMAGYMYDMLGAPIWYITAGPMSSPTTYTGPWMQFANGQPIEGQYRAPTLVNGNVGSVTLNFSDSRTATMTLPDGRVIPFTRFAF